MSSIPHPLALSKPAAGGDRAERSLLARLAHELRRPLTQIHGSIHVARAERAADAELGHGFDAMERQLVHLQNMLDDLASWARSADGADLDARERVDLAEIARAGEAAFAPLAHTRRVALVLDVKDGPHVVMGDRARLVQLVVNLLGKAFRFTPDGGGVVLSVWRCAGDELLQVRDSGEGIPPEQLACIFEPFRAGGEVSDMGLAVVRQVAASHGGWAGAHSAGAGQGTTFTAGFPALRA